jgi:hypothetical protein
VVVIHLSFYYKDFYTPAIHFYISAQGEEYPVIDLEIVSGVSAIALIIGLLEVAQKAGLDKKYVPFVSLAFGLLTSVGYFYFGGTTWFEAIVVGIVIGLCATGVCFGGREMVDAFRKHH